MHEERNPNGKAGTSSFRRIAARAARWTAGLIAGALVVGFAYETVAAAASARRHLPPGQLIEIDGRTMHLHCVGEGSPTVLLEAGMGGGVLAWSWIQPEVAAATRVCAYDRPGYGWSDPAPHGMDPQAVVRDLHALLQRAGEAGPYVLAGHSLGGHYARIFAEAYPDEVLGMVLVDARHPAIPERAENYASDTAQGVLMVRAMSMLARFGVMRLAGDIGGMLAPLPDGAREAALAHAATARHQRTYLAELLRLPASDALAADSGSLGDRPLVVLRAGLRLEAFTDAFWSLLEELQQDLATLSTNAELVTVPGAHHVSIVTERDNAQVVSRSILAVLERVQRAPMEVPE